MGATRYSYGKNWKHNLPPGCVYAAGGSGNDRGLSVTVDSNENIYVTGIFRNTATFNRHPLGQTAVTATSQGGSDMFIVKLNSSCELQWVYTAGGSGSILSFLK